MSNKEYEEFVNCFDHTNDVIVSEEELKVRIQEFNTWFSKLDGETRLQIADEIVPLITKASDQIRSKQRTLEEMILVNEGRMKANSHYGKY